MRLLTATGPRNKHDGFDRLWWRGDQWSSTWNGKTAYTDFEADYYLDSMPADSVPCVECEAPKPDGVVVPHGPERDKLVFKAIGLIRSRADGVVVCDGLLPTMPFTGRNHNWRWDRSTWNAVRARVRRTAYYSRMLGSVTLGAYICDPPGGNSGPEGSIDRDLLTFVEEAKAVRDAIPSTPIYAWVWSGFIFGPGSLDEADMVRVKSVVSDWSDAIVLWDSDEDESFKQFSRVLCA